MAGVQELDETKGLGEGFCYHAMQDDVTEALSKWEIAELPGSTAIPRRSLKTEAETSDSTRPRRSSARNNTTPCQYDAKD